MTCVAISTTILIIVAVMAGYELYKDGVWYRLDRKMRRRHGPS